MTESDNQTEPEIETVEDKLPAEKQESSDLNEKSAETNSAVSEESEPACVNCEDTEENQTRLSDIKAGLDSLSHQVEELNKLFAQKISYSVHEEKIVDSMHKDLEKYKQDMYAQIIKPILMDVIDIRDSILRMSAEYLKKPEEEQAVPNKIFAGYALDIQDVLERYGIEVYRNESESPYIPVKQRVLKKIQTNDESRHGLVAESLSCGYSYNGKVMMPEKIHLYYYEKTKIEDNSASEHQ